MNINYQLLSLKTAIFSFNVVLKDFSILELKAGRDVLIDFFFKYSFWYLWKIYLVLQKNYHIFISLMVFTFIDEESTSVSLIPACSTTVSPINRN